MPEWKFTLWHPPGVEQRSKAVLWILVTNFLLISCGYYLAKYGSDKLASNATGSPFCKTADFRSGENVCFLLVGKHPKPSDRTYRCGCASKGRFHIIERICGLPLTYFRFSTVWSFHFDNWFASAFSKRGTSILIWQYSASISLESPVENNLKIVDLQSCPLQPSAQLSPYRRARPLGRS